MPKLYANNGPFICGGLGTNPSQIPRDGSTEVYKHTNIYTDAPDFSLYSFTLTQSQTLLFSGFRVFHCMGIPYSI